MPKGANGSGFPRVWRVLNLFNFRGSADSVVHSDRESCAVTYPHFRGVSAML
jgi:hypothetical protein